MTRALTRVMFTWFRKSSWTWALYQTLGTRSFPFSHSLSHSLTLSLPLSAAHTLPSDDNSKSFLFHDNDIAAGVYITSNIHYADDIFPHKHIHNIHGVSHSFVCLANIYIHINHQHFMRFPFPFATFYFSVEMFPLTKFSVLFEHIWYIWQKSSSHSVPMDFSILTKYLQWLHSLRKFITRN